MSKPIMIGDTTIQRIVEQEDAFFDAFEFFPDLTKEMLEENRDWLYPVFFKPGGTHFNLCVQSYLVRTTHHTILVDTCVGNHKPRKSRAFWDNLASDLYEKNLAAAGVSVADIDIVLCTHLHTDHVGWNTKLENGQWVPTFPNARYVFSEKELSYWTERHSENAAAAPWITDSVLPIVAAQRCDLVKNDHQLTDGVQLIASPGHTIDHCSVHVSRSGNDALITGDMIHSPLQARYPELGMMSDYDSAEAGRSRRTIFDRFMDTPTLMCTSHFPQPSTGRFERWDDAYRFVPIET
jgi:glyoxylase-like metal-dependent hydrolase (beta-lactamase superfamily II)